MKNKVIIVAAGKGSRMGSEIPKQFLLLGGKPVLSHSIEAFRRFDPDILIVLVLPPEHMHEWDEIKIKYNLDFDCHTIPGGTSRFRSVSNGLAAIDDSGFTAVHDGVRPLISPATISTLFEEAGKKNNAIPYSLPSDSIRIEKKDTSVIIDRSSIRLIQTPQVFDTKLLKEAYLQKEHPSFTDDASVFEKMGHKIHLVECPSNNIKITRMEDLVVAEGLARLL